MSDVVRDKRDLYELAVRNGFYLPKRTSKAVTEEYLLEVLKGSCWCPRFDEIRLKACVRTPPVDVLLDKFREATLLHGKQKVHIDKDRRPDAKWLVDVVATLMPYDEIFAKDYVPPPRKPPASQLKVIDLDPSLLLGVPPSRSKAKSRRLRVIGTALTEQRIQRLQKL
jgi:hypothetical protein